ncbi:MAG: ribonuclease H-like domain-containing protein [Chitinophagaceae bacterium]|nr:ribonuclease H-like domain-containing protein [Oligoflexus sp.]
MTQRNSPFQDHALLRKSFIHLRGVGERTEKHLWSLGIHDWEDLSREASQIFGARKLADIQEDLDLTLEAWEKRDLYYFHKALPSADRWRMIRGAFDDIAYFDIEASGGGLPPLAESTVIAFLFRGELLQEHEKNAKRALIHYILEEASLLATFNGAAYDVPFLAHEFEVPFAKAHVDLCHWLRNQGFKGGLKAIQKAFPHLHQRSSMDIDGWDAVKLWRLYEQGHDAALTSLMCYNAEDVLILHPLLVEAYNRQSEANPELDAGLLSVSPLPELTTEVDSAIFAKLRSGSSFSFAHHTR